MTDSNQNNPVPIRTQFRRYECKYLISEELAAEIPSYAGPYLEPDPYAAASSDLSYDITSLYLDSPDLKLFQETEDGQLNRIKLRIRSYDDEPKSPVFLEIKRRFDRLVLKGRARIDKNTMAMILAGGAPGITSLKGDQKESYEEFVAWVARWLAQPMVWVKYRREAYVGVINPDIRITLDRNLRCLPARGLAGIEKVGSWLPVEPRNVILELKFDDSCPDWVASLIQRFRLDRQSYSKYGNSVRRGLLDQAGSLPFSKVVNS
jgi:VTC domain